MVATAALFLRYQSLVACNIYVSAGRPNHADLLKKLLKQAQGQCNALRMHDGGKIAIVHAFSDGPYDRSSFHLAGDANHVAAVASTLAEQAVKSLSTASSKEVPANESRHPFVGLVDHITVMPLSEENERLDNGDDDNDEKCVGWNASAWAARNIGSSLERLGVKVYFYGDADENKTSLATVRRERTSFFKSGGLNDFSDEPHTNNNKMGVATVGAPLTFVENFNIRLTSKCSKRIAQSLTKAVRERDGGLLGVEALTLPYSNGRYEVACNLLRPNIGSAKAVQEKVNEWFKENLKSMGFDPSDQLIETTYRVGTTVEQCRDILSREDEIDEHDKKVMARLNRYLMVY